MGHFGLFTTCERVFDTKRCISLQVRSHLSVFPQSEPVLVSDFMSHFVAMAGLSLDFSKTTRQAGIQPACEWIHTRPSSRQDRCPSFSVLCLPSGYEACRVILKSAPCVCGSAWKWAHMLSSFLPCVCEKPENSVQLSESVIHLALVHDFNG